MISNRVTLRALVDVGALVVQRVCGISTALRKNARAVVLAI
jgi:hypothetical protein